MPFVPLTDELPGTCRDYFAIDGSAFYETTEGHWLWVSRSLGEAELGQLSMDQVKVPDLDDGIRTDAATGQTLTSGVEHDAPQSALAGQPEGQSRRGGVLHGPEEDLTLWRAHGQRFAVG
jgi:hypothetical protein